MTARPEMKPMPPCWLALAEQLQWSPLVVHWVVVQPAALKIVAALSQVTGTDETDRHGAASVNVTEPVVWGLSVKLPSSLTVTVPVVEAEPRTGIFAHPRLSWNPSMSP